LRPIEERDPWTGLTAHKKEKKGHPRNIARLPTKATTRQRKTDPGEGGCKKTRGGGCRKAYLGGGGGGPFRVWKQKGGGERPFLTGKGAAEWSRGGFPTGSRGEKKARPSRLALFSQRKKGGLARKIANKGRLFLGERSISTAKKKKPAGRGGRKKRRKGHDEKAPRTREKCNSVLRKGVPEAPLWLKKEKKNSLTGGDRKPEKGFFLKPTPGREPPYRERAKKSLERNPAKRRGEKPSITYYEGRGLARGGKSEIVPIEKKRLARKKKV